MKELGSEVARQPEGEVVQQSKSSQSSRPNPNPDLDRTVKPVVCPRARASRSQEIETRSFREEAVKNMTKRRNPLFAVMKIRSNQLLSALIKRLTHVSLVNEGENLILEEETNHDRTVKPVVCRDTSHAQRASQTRFFHESTNFNVGDETNHDRTEKPVVCPQRGAEQFVFGDDETESDLSFRIQIILGLGE